MATATKKTTLKSFTATARLTLDIGIDIQAESLEAALAQAKELKLGDIVTLQGDLYDNKGPVIVGVHSDENI